MQQHKAILIFLVILFYSLIAKLLALNFVHSADARKKGHLGQAGGSGLMVKWTPHALWL